MRRLTEEQQLTLNTLQAILNAVIDGKISKDEADALLRKMYRLDERKDLTKPRLVDVRVVNAPKQKAIGRNTAR